jgi:hypothetical protein
MDITTDRAKLHNQLKALAVHWEDLKGIWDDSVRREFEENHWEALEAHVQAALRAMDQLSTVMVQVRHDCS